MDPTPQRRVIDAVTCETLLAEWDALAAPRNRAADTSPQPVEAAPDPTLNGPGGAPEAEVEPGDWPEWSPLDLSPGARPAYHPSLLLPLFPRLRLEPGWELDYVYCEEEFGFEMTLYTRRSRGPHYSKRFDVPFEARLLPGLQVDPGPEGAFELALFLILGRRLFYRSDEDQPAFTRGRFMGHARRITQFPGAEVGADGGEEEPAEGVDWEARFASRPPEFFLPAVEPLPDGTHEVTMIWYTPWGGLERRAFGVGPGNTSAPAGKETLVPYDCGEIY